MRIVHVNNKMPIRVSRIAEFFADREDVGYLVSGDEIRVGCSSYANCCISTSRNEERRGGRDLLAEIKLIGNNFV